MPQSMPSQCSALLMMVVLMLGGAVEEEHITGNHSRRGSHRINPVAPSDVTPSEVTLFDVTHLEELQGRVKTATASALPATVAVDNGSGVIVRDDGLILTVAHALHRSEGLAQVVLPDGRRRQADILGVDRTSDTAILKLVGGGPWPTVPMVEGAAPQDSSWCLAAGYPSAFTRGKPAVVRLGRTSLSEEFGLISNCTLMGGDSGGPLLNLDGQLIGLNSRIRSELDQNYHLPIQVFWQLWEIPPHAGYRIRRRSDSITQLTSPQADPSSSGATAAIGINAETDEGRLRVRRVLASSPAGVAGLKSEDVILQLGGIKVTDFQQFYDLLERHKRQSQVEMIVNRFGKLIRLTIDLQQVEWYSRDSRIETDVTLNRENDRPAIPPRSAKLNLTLTELAESKQQHVVEVWGEHQRLALGTLISPTGWVLTKHSLLDSVIQIRLADGRNFPADLIAADLATDLALLQLRGDHSTKSNTGERLGEHEQESIIGDRFAGLDLGTSESMRPNEQGELLISVFPDGEADVVRLGVVIAAADQLEDAVSSRRLGSDPAARYQWGLDFHPDLQQVSYKDQSHQDYQTGIRVRRVHPRLLGERFFLLQDDLIYQINQQPITLPADFQRLSDQLSMGQPVELAIVRRGRLMRLQSTMRSHWSRSEHDLWGGGAFNDRRFGLGRVIIHDIPIRPDQCGGPVFDIHGNFRGINLARSLRTASLVMPVDRLAEFVEMTKRNQESKQWNTPGD